jgi:hypothetical protein
VNEQLRYEERPDVVYDVAMERELRCMRGWLWGALCLCALACGGDDDDGAALDDAATGKDGGRLDAAVVKPKDAGTRPRSDAKVQMPVDSGVIADAGFDAGLVVGDEDAGAEPPACAALGNCATNGRPCGNGDECGSGFCADGRCCESACSGGGNDCRACAAALTGKPDGVCAPLPSGTRCRDSAGSCDFAEVCDGASALCPGDVLLPAGIVCRSAQDLCDREELCTGLDAQCPIDALRPVGTPCRAAVGPCDLPDVCSGTAASCADALRPPSFMCRVSSGGICDVPDYCSGDSTGCAQQYLAGVECRASQAACDLPELCSGASASCPPDQVMSAGIVCRPSVLLPCDPAEVCDGVASTCPANVETCP